MYLVVKGKLNRIEESTSKLLDNCNRVFHTSFVPLLLNLSILLSKCVNVYVYVYIHTLINSQT